MAKRADRPDTAASEIYTEAEAAPDMTDATDLLVAVVRKRSASVMACSCRSETNSKRRARYSSPVGTQDSCAGSSSSLRGSMRVIDYRELVSLGDVVRMFIEVGRGGTGPSNAGEKEVTAFESENGSSERGNKLSSAENDSRSGRYCTM